jgi:predicted small metal-binding protein
VDIVLHCHCGFEARAADEDGLVHEVQRHASEAHAMRLTDEEALLLAFRAQLNDRGPAIPRQEPHIEKEER